MYSGLASDVSVGVGFDPTPGFERLLASRSMDFFNRERFEVRGEELLPIDVPTDAGISIHREWLLIRPRTDWTVGATTYPAGALLAAKYDEFIVGTVELVVVFEPDDHTSLDNFAWTRDQLILGTLADVATNLELVVPGSWQREPISGIPANATTVIVDADEHGDEIFLDSSGFDKPIAAAVGARRRRADRDQECPGVLRRLRPRRAAALRCLCRRHHDPVLRRRAW